jgi:formylglycine-generating enzyme required for sulfatase activity
MTTSPARAAALALLVAAVAAAPAACAPSAQALIYVDTDAPVPPAPGDLPDPTRPAALVDRLRLDVFAPDGAIAATQEFAVHAGLFAARAVSFGVAPPVGTDGVRVRARLYRGDRVERGEPPPSVTLDATVTLPPLGADERRAFTIFLAVEDVGRARGLPPDAPLAPTDGAPTASRVGTWPGAAFVPCASAPRPGEACIPGGAFWFGDPRRRASLEGPLTPRERLVVLSPFFLRTHEVTVAELRARWAALRTRTAPTAHDPTESLSSLRTWCVWTEQPGPFEQLPINCVTREIGEAFCRDAGGALPTEAQLELAASGRGAELDYPWGTDDPQCGDAIFGLAGGGAPVSNGVATCRSPGDRGGQRVGGSGLFDRVTYATPEPAEVIVDLAGNLAEWARDRWSALDDAYWAQDGVLVDPVADLVSADGAGPWVTRGGSWLSPPYEMRAATRKPARDAVTASIGFRCARPATAAP